MVPKIWRRENLEERYLTFYMNDPSYYLIIVKYKSSGSDEKTIFNQERIHARRLLCSKLIIAFRVKNQFWISIFNCLLHIFLWKFNFVKHRSNYVEIQNFWPRDLWMAPYLISIWRKKFKPNIYLAFDRSKKTKTKLISTAFKKDDL